MSRDRGAHEGRVEVHDLPQGVLLGMAVTQAVVGTFAGWLIARTIQRAFIAVYTILTTEHEQMAGHAP